MFDLIQERDTGRDMVTRSMIYVITHGEANPSDDELLDEGKQQIRELARSRVATGVRRIYSSPNTATVASAGILREEFGAIVEVSDCLAELFPGKHRINEREFEEIYLKIWANPDYEPQDGESLYGARQRFGECMNRIGAKNRGDVVAVVTHPLVGALFLSLVAGGPPQLEDWLLMGYGSCAAYEHSKTGWGLVMPPDNSFLSNATTVEQRLPESFVKKLRHSG